MIWTILVSLLGMVHSQPDPRHVVPRLTTDDSVSVLLLSGFELQELVFSTRSGLTVNRLRPAGAITISVEQRPSSPPPGESGSWQISSALDETITIAGAGRSRRLRGVVTVSREGRRLRAVARIALREYLAGSLTAEASPSDPVEYLVALSVLQRNYIASHRGRHGPDADLCDNTHCQLTDLRDRSPRILLAVDSAFRIGLESGSSLPCYYSVNCGGSTLTPSQIWNHTEQGYSNVRCSHCRNSIRFRWERTAAATPELESILRGIPRTPFVDDDFKIRLGRAIGFNKVLSNTIDKIERRGSHYLFAGRGFGHRVGMCQEGAHRLAGQGRNAEQILRFYFPAATLTHTDI